LWRALRAVAEGGAGRPGYDVQVTGLVRALLLVLAQAGSGGGDAPAVGAGRLDETAGAPRADDAAARLAVRYVHDNLHRRLPVGEIAAHMGLSARHLSRLFARFTGTSPADYVERARLDRARALLLRSDSPIKAVAETVGYASVHHFTRAFARRFGCPPGAFRRTDGSAGDPNARVANRQNPGALV
jgi:AraC family L-rhamnose operon transcriptional activator RhaR